jgi:hypothetical protein
MLACVCIISLLRIANQWLTIRRDWTYLTPWFLAFNPDESVEVQGGELDDKLDADGNRLVGGRPTTDDAAATLQGKNLRQQLCDLVARHGHVRPATNWFKNRNGLIECID